MITAEEIIEEIEEALRLFRYDFGDKGPDEVMELAPIVNKLKQMTGVEASVVLEEVSKYKDTYQEGLSVVESLLNYLSESPEKWWNELITHPTIKEIYEEF